MATFPVSFPNEPPVASGPGVVSATGFDATGGEDALLGLAVAEGFSVTTPAFDGLVALYPTFGKRLMVTASRKRNPPIVLSGG